MAIARPARKPGGALLQRFKPALIAIACLSVGYYTGRASQPGGSSLGRQPAAAAGGKVRYCCGRGVFAFWAQHSCFTVGFVSPVPLPIQVGSASSSGSSSGGSSSDSSPAAVKSVCENTCTGYTRNGVCDEGRPNAQAPPESQPDSAAVFEVLCDLGTDCGDCGPWVSLESCLVELVGGLTCCCCFPQGTWAAKLAGAIEAPLVSRPPRRLLPNIFLSAGAQQHGCERQLAAHR